VREDRERYLSEKAEQDLDILRRLPTLQELHHWEANKEDASKYDGVYRLPEKGVVAEFVYLNPDLPVGSAHDHPAEHIKLLLGWKSWLIGRPVHLRPYVEIVNDESTYSANDANCYQYDVSMYEHV
jgi:hypothetical protein